MHGLDDERAAYRDRLVAAGLGPHAHGLLALARPSVRLVADPRADVPSQASRLGGDPVLPAGAPWPRREGRPLSLIAQVDLGEIHALVPGVLPPDGLLSFFYDAVRQEAWGSDPADRGSSVVLHSPGEGAVTRQPPPDLDAVGRFAAIALRPTLELSFAPWESFDLERLGLGAGELDGYREAHELADGTVHRLLGHPEPVQGDMQVECQRATGGPDGEAEQWRLLLQVDSEEGIGMAWGDAGRLYYWIRQSDLADRHWDRSWLVLQCC